MRGRVNSDSMRGTPNDIEAVQGYLADPDGQGLYETWRGMPSEARWGAGPMPDRSNILGEISAPAHRITCHGAFACLLTLNDVL